MSVFSTSQSLIPEQLEKKLELELTNEGQDLSVTPASNSKEKPSLYWMVKPCEDYKEEYSDCKSFKARFHQYFVNGDISDCSQWKRDFDNCSLWEKDEDMNALIEVVESEKSRVRERLQGHYENDIWESRKEPPADWNSELPSDILEGYADSFLKQKSEELKEGTETFGHVEQNIKEETMLDKEWGGSMCSIV